MHGNFDACVASGEGMEPPAETLDRSHYTLIFRKIALALLEDDEFGGDLPHAVLEARQQAEESWADDSSKGSALSRMQWYDSLFELADTWTVGIAPIECTHR